MSDLSKLLELNQILESLKGEIGDNEGKQDEKSPKSDDLLLIYTTSKMCIYEMADILSSSSFNGDTNELLSSPPGKIEVPLQYEWDLKLGDRVRIKYPLKEFKYIQQETTGWTSGLSQYLGHTGFVSHLFSQYDNRVRVAFTESNTISAVYAGVLEKVETQDDDFQSKWKPGDYIRTRADNKVSKILQRGLGNIPSKYIGERGRIVDVAPAGVFVTFDERETYVIKSALLLPCKDKSSLKVPRDNKHPKGIEVGDKVQVISNLKKLILNQKMCGGWNPEMHIICGKEVKVTDINGDGTIDVAIRGSVGWRVSADSINEIDQPQEKDLDFLLEDKVKVKMPENIRNLLATKGIPPVFLEYLRSTAIVNTVDADLEAVIKFNKEHRIAVNMRSLRKATKDEIEKYDFIQENENFKPGDSVYLDVGPPNYVRYILMESDSDPTIIKAMTNAATFLGYVDAKYGVIQYTDGSMHKIKTKLLTVPKKFGLSEESGMADVKKKFSLKVVDDLQQILSVALEKIHKENQEIDSVPEVEIINVQLQGQPPSTSFRVRSDVASLQQLTSKLQESMDVEIICKGVLGVTNFGPYEHEIKVNFMFNDEEYVSRELEPGVITETYEGGEAIDAQAIPWDRRQPDAEPLGSQPPVINDLQQFRYLRFHDISLAQTVYFPYVVHGPRRVVAEPEEIRGHQRQPVYNIQYVNSLVGGDSIEQGTKYIQNINYKSE